MGIKLTTEITNENKPSEVSIKQEQQQNEELSESIIQDDGKIEISDNDVYHPDMETPSQQITNNLQSP